MFIKGCSLQCVQLLEVVVVMWSLVVTVSVLMACWTWRGAAAAANKTLSFSYITSKTGSFVTAGAIPWST